MTSSIIKNDVVNLSKGSVRSRVSKQWRNILDQHFRKGFLAYMAFSEEYVTLWIENSQFHVLLNNLLRDNSFPDDGDGMLYDNYRCYKHHRREKERFCFHFGEHISTMIYSPARVARTACAFLPMKSTRAECVNVKVCIRSLHLKSNVEFLILSKNSDHRLRYCLVSFSSKIISTQCFNV